MESRHLVKMRCKRQAKIEQAKNELEQKKPSSSQWELRESRKMDGQKNG